MMDVPAGLELFLCMPLSSVTWRRSMRRRKMSITVMPRVIYALEGDL